MKERKKKDKRGDTRVDCPSLLQKVPQSAERESSFSVRLCTGQSLAGSPVSQCRQFRFTNNSGATRSQALDALLAASAAWYELVAPGGGEAGPGLHQLAGGGAVEGLLAAGAEFVEAVGAPAGGPLSLGVVRRRRAAAHAAAQRLVLLQVAGGLRGDTQVS